MKEHSDSIIQHNRCCYVCGETGGLHRHHIYGGARRDASEEDGCWIYLCGSHHNLSNEGIHFNKKLDTKVKIQAEKIWINTYVPELTREEQIDAFIKRFGRNYLDE